MRLRTIHVRDPNALGWLSRGAMAGPLSSPIEEIHVAIGPRPGAGFNVLTSRTHGDEAAAAAP